MPDFAARLALGAVTAPLKGGSVQDVPLQEKARGQPRSGGGGTSMVRNFPHLGISDRNPLIFKRLQWGFPSPSFPISPWNGEEWGSAPSAPAPL